MAPKEGSMDAAISNLKEILAAINDANLRLETMCGEVEGGNEARTALLEEIEGDWEDLIKAADNFHEGLEEGANEADEKYDEVTGAVTGTFDTLEECTSSIDGVNDALPDAIGEVKSAVDDMLAEMQDAYTEITEEMGEVVESMQEATDAVEEAFDAIGDALGDLKEKVSNFMDETVSDFTDAATEIGENLLESAETAFENVAGKVGDDLVPALLDGLGEIGGACEELFNNFLEMGEKIGEELLSSGEQILTDLVETVKDEIMEALKEAFEKMIEEVVTAIVEEIAENSIILAVGSACTGVLAPYIPVLAVAEKILEAFNLILEALSFGM
ncbi:MAG: hypothetical protein ACR2IE_17210 [Candidatus Sumerlaeaceae bacterium]